MKVKMLLLLLLATAAVRLSAQSPEDIEVIVSAPEEMALGINCRISFKINIRQSKNCVWPADDPADWLEVLIGPTSARSTMTSFIDGVTTTSYSTTFTYIVKPLKEGLHVIPAAKLTDSLDVVYRSPLKVVRVVPASEEARQKEVPALDPFDVFFNDSRPTTPDPAIDKAIRDLDEGIDAWDDLAEESEQYDKEDLTEDEQSRSMTVSFAMGQREAMMTTWREELDAKEGSMTLSQQTTFHACRQQLINRGIIEEDSYADPEITRLLSAWEGYVRQYRKEIDELEGLDHGPRIPGLFIYKDEEKCYNQLTRHVSRMTPQQLALYNKLNAICNNEFSTYMPRLSRE